ncbi:putative proline-rich receptor-like protein kinase PERK6 isoform X2 [Manihot esculenta]|uniref:putative proline-rich receptor-like protein kinase PERK6 isoform X2 n=1 Tax=Manihot esculenta TaxID=3983 RepID=UPI001CC72025|nr:putative proline-rich receptor-like protein kinase PERK6 isoform X2 [Manihot esculenta]
MMGCIQSRRREDLHFDTRGSGTPPPVLPSHNSPNRRISSPNRGQSQGYGLRQFTYMELAIATEHFSNNVLLGEGGFGQVYKGFIDGKLYAVKKLKNQPDEQTQATMEEEIRVISRVRHRNLVELIGYCIQGNNRLLVLEFLSNKSLKYHLHGKEVLEWSNRMKIAIGSAKGLKYLHEDCNPRIIHRDIKADNIVLDENFEPKVTDFGLSLFFPENVTHISKSIHGTEVYVDPIYSGRVSYESDVYSFGVVLLELITGRKTMIGDTTIVNWVIEVSRGNDTGAWMSERGQDSKFQYDGAPRPSLVF